ncbi:hypothetical protein [Nocardia sp. NPDC049149]|uniref:hypothetical protein n=1 Tax=Nocardia sp. NPDC049149 TaxID=3364315 RepID=UPI00371E2E0C
MRKILFIGGPIHMDTREFDGRPPGELFHPAAAKPALDPLKTELHIVGYRLQKVSIDQPHPPRFPSAPATLAFHVYLAEGENINNYPEAALHLYQMWPEISAV